MCQYTHDLSDNTRLLITRGVQMLSVTIYDQLETPSKVAHTFGYHRLITVYCGKVDWKIQLTEEIHNQIGQLLVAGIVTLLQAILWLYADISLSICK